MSEYQAIRALLRAKPFLVADGATGKVRLVNRAAAFRRLAESGEFPSAVVMNVGRALENFSRLHGVGREDREFNLKDIAQIAGMEYQLAWHYMTHGVLTPSVRPPSGKGRGDVEARFSWADAYCAGAIGSLRRHGLKLDVLRKVQPLFSKSRVPKKRTGRKAVTSGRS